jgi:hypothetical protein
LVSMIVGMWDTYVRGPDRWIGPGLYACAGGVGRRVERRAGLVGVGWGQAAWSHRGAAGAGSGAWLAVQRAWRLLVMRAIMTGVTWL